MFSLVNDDSNMFAFFEQSFTFHPNTTNASCSYLLIEIYQVLHLLMASKLPITSANESFSRDHLELI